ncbi:RNA chaperone Hfq, partial [Staphylococcus epidermidis]|uniref:RNA chaperone Hfq n=1 Tax=Staphylococcus epidermidis TaxID=1282 RepID=UPI0011A9D6E9
NFKSQKTQLTIFFLNHFQMKGVLQNYHKYLVTLNSQPNQHLIYKHPITTFTLHNQSSQPTQVNTQQ